MPAGRDGIDVGCVVVNCWFVPEDVLHRPVRLQEPPTVHDGAKPDLSGAAPQPGSEPGYRPKAGHAATQTWCRAAESRIGLRDPATALGRAGEP